ncbi:MAG: PspC domain-containing protein [Woeseiaceae bacterium]|nr:PspC domain-containing protein [Woeseiaceae bacterium]
MSTYASMRNRRFYRNADKAMLGGVCAGIADYFGFNLCVTRVLALIAFFAMPLTAIGYLALVLLIPSMSARDLPQPVDPAFRKAVRSSPTQTMSDMRGRFKSLDRRLARIEKYVTSSRYQLDREFDRLKD